jgi:hypothetical protein
VYIPSAQSTGGRLPTSHYTHRAANSTPRSLLDILDIVPPPLLVSPVSPVLLGSPVSPVPRDPPPPPLSPPLLLVVVVGVWGASPSPPSYRAFSSAIRLDTVVREPAKPGGWEGGVGVWESGSVGVWECGSVGVWECGSVGVWECGRGASEPDRAEYSVKCDV